MAVIKREPSVTSTVKDKDSSALRVYGPTCMLFKYLHDEVFKQLILGREKLGRPASMEEPELACEDVLKMSSAKEKDLMKLCSKGAIPSEYDGCYKGLKSIQKHDCIEISENECSYV